MDDNAAATPAPSPSEWLAFAFIRDAPCMPNGQYLGIETAPVEPWPHQRVVARRLVDGWPLSWMLCDEVGLGKTIEAGLALRALRMSGYVGRALIAVPASIAAQWQRELADKCLLPVARALGGAHPRHRLLLPREHERAAASLFEPELLVVSTGLLTRRERQLELKGADGWDLVLLDEAHCARRSNPTAAPESPPRWTRLYRIARDVLRPKAAALWLATATPMQLEPIEAIDLATLTRRLGPFALEPRVALAYYGLLARLRAGAGLEPLEWRFVARAARHVLRFDPAAARFVERSVMRGRAGAALQRWLDAPDAANAAPAPPLRKAVLRLLFAVAPLSRAMMRHDRGLLRRYQREGRLAAPLPTRKVHLPAIRLTAAEREVYDRFAPYCRTLAEQVRAHSRQRIAVGFMLSFFGLRFASSYKAIHDTLARRRDKVAAALEGRLSRSPGETLGWSERDWDERDWEDHEWERRDLEGRAHDEADTPDDELLTAGLHWRSRVDLGWEVEQLTALLERLAPLAQLRSPKVRALLKALRARRGADGRLRQAVVFTRFYDTLVDLQGWVEHDEPSVRLGVFSGPRCAWMDEAGGWHGASREEVKRRFVRGDIDLLLCTDAAAEGLNLQSADLLVNFDLPWNPMKLEQRIGRIDRIGQRHRTVHVINLAYPGTVEEEVYVRLLRRIQGAAGTVGAQPLVVLPVDPADLRRLSTGELEPERLEAIVRERLRLARERAESMSPTAAELHALYRELGDELAAAKLPMTLGEVFETLAASATLKALGSERIETTHGAALLVRGIPGCEPCLLTVSRALYERGLPGRDEPLRFATWGEPVFDALVAHVLARGHAPAGFARACADVSGTRASVVSWVVSTNNGPVVVEEFGQLATLQPGGARRPDAAALERAKQRAAARAEAVASLRQVERDASLAAVTHHRIHRALAAKLVAAAPKGSRLRELEAHLPDCTRTLRIPKLDPALVAAEAEYGLLEAKRDAIDLPAFYQRCLVATIERERLALRRARRGEGEEEIALAELAERLLRGTSPIR
ncbi:MAG: DEAD/DEAH box helicase [Burkholderiaceae bacterium]|nr:DEAD/DEAH box helicase [Burkholderiaceae bacterium]